MYKVVVKNIKNEIIYEMKDYQKGNISKTYKNAEAAIEVILKNI